MSLLERPDRAQALFEGQGIRSAAGCRDPLATRRWIGLFPCPAGFIGQC